MVKMKIRKGFKSWKRHRNRNLLLVAIIAVTLVAFGTQTSFLSTLLSPEGYFNYSIVYTQVGVGVIDIDHANVTSSIIITIQIDRNETMVDNNRYVLRDVGFMVYSQNVNVTGNVVFNFENPRSTSLTSTQVSYLTYELGLSELGFGGNWSEVMVICDWDLASNQTVVGTPSSRLIFALDYWYVAVVESIAFNTIDTSIVPTIVKVPPLISQDVSDNAKEHSGEGYGITIIALSSTFLFGLLLMYYLGGRHKKYSTR